MARYTATPTYACYLDSSNPNTSYYGASMRLVPSGLSEKVVLLEIPVSIPVGALILSAQLRLWITTNTGTKKIWVARMIQTWDWEDATWNEWDNSANEAWDTAGAKGADVDYSTTNDFEATRVSGTDAYKTIDTGTDFVALVQDAIDSRGGALRLRLAFPAGIGIDDLRFHGISGDHPPKLRVEFQDSGGGAHALGVI